MKFSTGETVFLIVSSIMILFISYLAGNGDGYRHGQIDYANNIIKYHLEQQPDGTTQWQLIKQNK